MGTRIMNLYRWLDEQKFFTRTTDVPIASHLIYDGYRGGKVYVPRNREYEFLSYYSKEFANKTPLYFVEVRPKTFKFMIDIDISSDHYWSLNEIVDLVAFIQCIIVQFFIDTLTITNIITICCTSPVKMKKDKTHTGIHLIWPNLFITADVALTIRRGLIQKLKEWMKDFDWNMAIDETIYTKNGFRMVGSDKMSKDKVPENRPLQLLFVMNSDKTLNEIYFNRLKKDFKSLILETSIRYVLDAYMIQGMSINFPQWLEEDDIVVKTKPNGVGSLVSSKEHHIIEQFIRYNFPKEYSRGVVREVTRYPDKNLLIKTNSKFCMNIGREHNSCGIYFHATPYGLTQRCLCTCQKLDGRKHGLCCDFKSETKIFNDHVKDILFPDLAENLFLKKKKENTFEPGAESLGGKLKTQQKTCNKLFNDIVMGK